MHEPLQPTPSSRGPEHDIASGDTGIQVLSENWRYLFVNEVAGKHLQKRTEDLLGRTLHECHPGVDVTRVFAAMLECRRENTPTSIRHECLFADGTSRELLLQLMPMWTGICVLSTDVTASRLPATPAVAATEELDHYLTLILDAAIGGITTAASSVATDLFAELQTIAALSRAAAARVGELKRLAAGASTPGERRNTSAGLRVLVVEDTRAVADVLVRQLRAAGHETVLAADAAAALRVWPDRAQQIDLVLTDLQLPDMSGIDLIRALRRTRPDLPGLCISGGPRPDSLDERVRFLEKPFTMRELQAELAALLR